MHMTDITPLKEKMVVKLYLSHFVSPRYILVSLSEYAPFSEGRVRLFTSF
jgi:hypothetical protein